jgi:WD40 repeat protein
MGCTDGSVRVLDSATLLEEGENEGLAVFKHCHDSITHLVFSHDSKYLASAVSAWNSTAIYFYFIFIHYYFHVHIFMYSYHNKLLPTITQASYSPEYITQQIS